MDDHRLSQIETLWSVVRRAHDDGATVAGPAQELLLERYGGAIRRYILAALRNQDAADEVFQEFALKFAKGDFARANPDRGCFRSLVKTVVYRLVVDYQRRAGRNARVGNWHTNMPEPAAAADSRQQDEIFKKSWRDELLARAWATLQQEEERTQKPYYTALRLRVDYPDLRSPELAQRLSESLGKPMQAGATRVLLHRARDSFAELLLREVVDSLPNDSLEAAEEELIDLDLFEYCRPVLKRRRESS